ncbi:G-protein coupled receptor-associated protein LMBRD2-like isoform X2 [Apostichopus japonicus]|uniref:G-protein coupled receptor-associated protein LMBRD2-like isoform X2 n=1 Tax=Stichopus japonicus TaxID=307972 RepID=UPI003AB17BAB
MSVGPLVVEILCIFALSAYLLHKYGDWRKQHPLVTIIVFISWYFSFIIIFVLPLDVTTTFYKQCVHDSVKPSTAAPSKLNEIDTTLWVDPKVITTEDVVDSNRIRRESPPVNECHEPWSYVPENILPIIWSIVYWTSYLLTWIVMPMMKSYVSAGAFTVRGKLKAAVVENLIWYGSYLLIFGVFLIYAAVDPKIELDIQNLQVIGITASNTWGLLLLVLLLGYGLVEVPRKYWYQSKKGYLLNYIYFQLAKLSTEKSEAEEHLEDVLEDVRRVSDVIKYNHASRKNVNTIISKCPDTFQDSLVKHLDDFQDYGQRKEQIPSEKDLVKLHSKVIYAMQSRRRTSTQWDILVEKAFELEDVKSNESNHSKNYHHTYDPNYNGLKSYICTPNVEWHWRILLMPTILKVVAVVLVIGSVMVIWCEMTFFCLSPNLSLFSIFVDSANSKNNYLVIEIICIVIMAFLSVCSYYTVFKIRIFDFYLLAPHHQTDENSLLFCGMMLCRLTPPLCLNFLSLIHLDTRTDELETAYTGVMGRHLDLLPFIQSGFNVYYPIIVAVLCLATYFHLGSRCLSCLGFQQFVGDDDMTEDMIEEGHQLMKREKRKRERALKSESRKRYIEKIKPRENGQRLENLNSHSDRSFNREAASGNMETTSLLSKFSKDSSDGEHRVEIFKDADGVDFSDNTVSHLGDGVDFSDKITSHLGDDVNDYSASGASSDSGMGRQYGRQSKGIFDDV